MKKGAAPDRLAQCDLLQMLVYYSALSPCIAFTYLLRGVDIVTILLILFYTLWASVFLSSLSLLVATASRLRHMQVLLSVVTALQAPNWLWTLVEAADGNASATLPATILVTVAALLSFGANLLAAAREVEQVRQEAPARVQLDERELHPERVAVEKRPASPFDEP
ncbi:MAG: hypothetical protein ACYC6N_16575 [Pirellulaceae bacterium]